VRHVQLLVAQFILKDKGVQLPIILIEFLNFAIFAQLMLLQLASQLKMVVHALQETTGIKRLKLVYHVQMDYVQFHPRETVTVWTDHILTQQLEDV